MTPPVKSEPAPSLPPGIVVEQITVLHPAVRHLRVRDERLDSAWPAEVDLVDRETAERWPAPDFLERLRLLMRQPFRRLVLPREAGQSPKGPQCWYIVTDIIGTPISAHLTREGLTGHSPAAAFHELLEALAELEELGVAHGGLHPGVVYLSDVRGECPASVRVGGLTLGPLGYWSGNECSSEAAHYWPPEALGRAPLPSAKADLYAAGLIGCELFLGSGALRDRSLLADRDALGERLRSAGATAAMRRVLLSLVAVDAGMRPASAREALSVLGARRSVRWLWPAVGAVAVVVIAGLGWRLWESRAALRELDEKLEKSKQAELQLQEGQAKVQEQLKLSEQTSSGLRLEVDRLTRRPHDEPAPEVVGEWNTLLEQHWNHFDAELPERLDNLRKQAQIARSEIQAWEETFRTLQSDIWHGDVWLRSKDHTAKGFQDALKAFVQRPWDVGLQSSVEARLIALNRAADEWEAQAKNEHLTFDQVEKQFALAKGKSDAESEEVRNILLQWWAETQKRGNWTLRFDDGTPPAGDVGDKEAAKQNPDGIKRAIRITIGKESVSVPLYVWPTKTSVSLPNRPDKSVKVEVWDKVNYVRTDPYLINEEFNGPLAMWRLHFAAPLRFTDESVSRLFIEILNCPGPPKELFTPSVGRKDAEDKARKTLGL